MNAGYSLPDLGELFCPLVHCIANIVFLVLIIAKKHCSFSGHMSLYFLWIFSFFFSLVKPRNLLTKRTGTFHSTNYPGNYPNGLTLEFLLEAPPKAVANISVNFVDFALEQSKRCLHYDYVKVYKQDVGSVTWKEITPAYCGTRSIPAITAVSQRLLVKFVSDATRNDRGFNATYSIETIKGKSRISVIR